jgi:hypothetical protein
MRETDMNILSEGNLIVTATILAFCFTIPVLHIYTKKIQDL